MPLENFYQESDEIAHRRNGRIVLAFVATAAYLIFGYVLLYNYWDSQEVLKEEAERTKGVYALCDGLSKPESFVFVRRSSPFNQKNGTSVKYFYKSPDTHDEIMIVFYSLLDSKSWKRIADRNSFTNGFQTISIDRAHENDADYYLLCSQETLSFGVYD